MFAWVDTPILRCHGKRKVGLSPLFFVSHVGISYSHLRLFTDRSPLWLRLLRRSSSKRFSMKSCLEHFLSEKREKPKLFFRATKLFQNGSDSSGGAYQTRPYFPHACYACHRWSVDFFVNICQYIYKIYASQSIISYANVFLAHTSLQERKKCKLYYLTSRPEWLYIV